MVARSGDGNTLFYIIFLIGIIAEPDSEETHEEKQTTHKPPYANFERQ